MNDGCVTPLRVAVLTLAPKPCNCKCKQRQPQPRRFGASTSNGPREQEITPRAPLARTSASRTTRELHHGPVEKIHHPHTHAHTPHGLLLTPPWIAAAVRVSSDVPTAEAPEPSSPPPRLPNPFDSSAPPAESNFSAAAAARSADPRAFHGLAFRIEVVLASLAASRHAALPRRPAPTPASLVRLGPPPSAFGVIRVSPSFGSRPLF